ncbi:hypothetical protein ACFQX6_67000 [Streptosporangium lutulentum]
MRSIDDRRALNHQISSQGGSVGHRAGGPEPDAWEAIHTRSQGLEIEVRHAADGDRKGLISWQHLRQWISAGLDAPSRDVLLTAQRAAARYRSAQPAFRALGEEQLHRLAHTEIDNLGTKIATEVIARALHARQAGLPLPGLLPRYGQAPSQAPTSLFDAGQDDTGDAAYAQRVERLQQFMDVLPARWYEPTPVSRLKPGDFLHHPLYSGDLYKITTSAVDRGEYFEALGEIVGRGQVVTDQWFKHEDPDPIVDVLVLPQSLEPLFDLDQQSALTAEQSIASGGFLVEEPASTAAQANDHDERPESAADQTSPAARRAAATAMMTSSPKLTTRRGCKTSTPTNNRRPNPVDPTALPLDPPYRTRTCPRLLHAAYRSPKRHHRPRSPTSISSTPSTGRALGS